MNRKVDFVKASAAHIKKMANEADAKTRQHQIAADYVVNRLPWQQNNGDEEKSQSRKTTVGGYSAVCISLSEILVECKDFLAI